MSSPDVGHRRTLSKRRTTDREGGLITGTPGSLSRVRVVVDQYLSYRKVSGEVFKETAVV